MPVALLMSFFFNYFGFTSAGAIAGLTLGMLVKELWGRAWLQTTAARKSAPVFHATDGILHFRRVRGRAERGKPSCAARAINLT